MTKPFALRVQLLPLQQDRSALGLLRFPSQLARSALRGIRCRWWSRGKSHRQSFSSAEETIEALSALQWNELELKYLTRPFELPGVPVTVTAIDSLFLPSPSSSLWSSARGFTASRRGDEQRRMSFESQERALKQNQIARMPSLFDTVAVLSCAEEERGLRPAVGKLLVETLAGADLPSRLIGCASLTEYLPDALGFDLLVELAPWPRAYPMLGDRFDDLHPFLIGPSNLCQGVSRSLGLSDSATYAPSGPHDRDIRVIEISPRILQDPQARLRAQDFLVPRDASTAPLGPDASLGEYDLGDEVGLTARRFRQLVDEEGLPPLEEDDVVFHALHPKYCELLDIPVDDMLVTRQKQLIADMVQRDIDNQFQQMSSVLPMAKRVWLAHASVLRKWPFLEPQLLFVKERFLPDVDEVP